MVTISGNVYFAFSDPDFFGLRKEKIHGSILGIITSCIGWIPIVGMIMHIITAVFLLIDAYKSSQITGFEEN